MSQEDSRRLLLELGGVASVAELSDLAERKYPGRTLSGYIRERLESMKQKDLVRIKTVGSKTRWELTEKGKNTPLETKIYDLGTVVDENTLSEMGVTVSNIVGSFNIGSRINLSMISKNLPNTEYYPERYNSALYRPEMESSATIIIPASGHVSITGSTTKEELLSSAKGFLETVQSMGIKTSASLDCVAIQNIVANFDFQREFDLNTLSIGLGLEKTEYEPEQFPGIIYRSSQNATLLIFNSGKCVITGAKSYSEIYTVIKEILEEFEKLGLELSTSVVESIRNT